MIVVIYFIMVFLSIFFSSFSFLNSIDFAFIFVFVVSFYFSVNTSLFFSFFSGIFVDFYYSFPVGTHSLIYLFMSYFIGFIRMNVDFDFIFSRFFNFTIFNLLSKVLAFLISNISGWKLSWQLSYLFSPFLSFIFFELVRFFMLKLTLLKQKSYDGSK